MQTQSNYYDSISQTRGIDRFFRAIIVATVLGLLAVAFGIGFEFFRVNAEASIQSTDVGNVGPSTDFGFANELRSSE